MRLALSASPPAVRRGEYAARGDYHREPDPTWDYYPTYLAKLDAVRKYLNALPRNTRVLDAGCGEGVLVGEFADRLAIEGVDPASLVGYSRWVTPETSGIRFDTRFYLGPAPEAAEPAVDGEECVDVGWFAPGEALAAFDRGELPLVFPTLKHFEAITGFATATELLDASRGRDVQAIRPQVVDGRIVLPGEPGYVD